MIPALKGGLLDRLYAAREETLRKGLGKEAANQAVENAMHAALRVPPASLRWLPWPSRWV